ncbi:MAG TPA: serine/threonine-protein kinase [Kofleriaceae bacterium]|nr:serine/threonine-protein kinase [Kofleriaceae bacterium]
MVSTAGAGLPPAPEGDDVLRPGSKAGPWLVERELGRGGMGAVYAVVHEEIGKRAALKVVHRRLMPGFNCERMLLEAKVVNQVGHPSIVDIFETGRLEDGRPYIVMERLCGQSLAVRADEGKLLPDLVIAVLLQVCDALIAAHTAGIVHRDLKLDNVFLIDNPDDPAVPRIKLLDWGIAKVIHTEVKHTIEGQLMGTPQYLSPEQARGLAVSPQTDVYSLGVMAYELFLEQLPFEAETAAEVMAMHLRATPPPPRELWPDIPPALEDLVLAMLAKQPDQRPTIVEVVRRLEAVRGEFQLRCRAHSGSGPAVAAVHARHTPSQAGRSRSSGFEATAFGWRSETRRWQIAIGGLALALSGLMFWISRAGDRAASAATTAAAITHAAPAATAALSVEPPIEPSRPWIEPSIEPSPRPIAAPTEPAEADEAPLRTAVARPSDLAVRPATLVTPAVHRARPERPSAAPHTPGRAGARHASSSSPVSSPSSSPAAPRPRAQVDPDGTLDVYR